MGLEHRFSPANRRDAVALATAGPAGSAVGICQQWFPADARGIAPGNARRTIPRRGHLKAEPPATPGAIHAFPIVRPGAETERVRSDGRHPARVGIFRAKRRERQARGGAKRILERRTERFLRGGMPSHHSQVPWRQILSSIARKPSVDRIVGEIVRRRQYASQSPAFGQSRLETRRGKRARPRRAPDETTADPSQPLARHQGARTDFSGCGDQTIGCSMPDAVEDVAHGVGNAIPRRSEIHPRSISDAMRSRKAKFVLRNIRKRSAGARKASGVWT